MAPTNATASNHSKYQSLKQVTKSYSYKLALVRAFTELWQRLNLLKAQIATMSPLLRPSSSNPRAKLNTSSTNCWPVFCRSPAIVTMEFRRTVDNRVRHWQMWA